MTENTQGILHRQLNDRQRAFIHYYLKNPNATRAAQLAGYSGNDVTLASCGYELLRNPQIRSEIDRVRKERMLSADALLDLLNTTATMDITPYIRDDCTLDVQEMAKDGLGHLVIGVENTPNGPRITLSNPQTARKILARHHRLIGASVEIDQSTTIQATEDQLIDLVQQIAAAAETDLDAPIVESDDDV